MRRFSQPRPARHRCGSFQTRAGSHGFQSLIRQDSDCAGKNPFPLSPSFTHSAKVRRVRLRLPGGSGRESLLLSVSTASSYQELFTGRPWAIYLPSLCLVPSVIEIKDRVSLQPTKYEKISANHISDKGLESGISKELQLNNKKKQRPD